MYTDGNETSFKMPDSVIEIRFMAFSYAPNLSQLTLAENLEKMGTNIFANTKITELHLPSKVKDIYRSSLGNMKVTISPSNPNLKTEDGIVILSKDGKKIITVSKSNVSTYNIPDSVETIGYGAFERVSCKEIKLPKKIKTIENAAFINSGITVIEIPSSIEYIGGNAFKSCMNLKEIIIHKSKLPDGSDPISGAPWGCPNTRETVKWDN